MKYVLISGCSGGMGIATVKKFIDKGYFVFGLDIKEPKEILENFVFIKTNLREQESINNAYKIIKDKADQLEAIISMSGIYDLNSLIEMSEEDFIRIFDIFG